MNNKEIFGKRFREIRKNFGYTQEKIAEIAGIEPQSISKIESGKNFPLLSNLEKIADKLSIKIEDFFDYGHKISQNDMKNELFEIYENLNLKEKEQLLRIAKIFKV